MLPGSNALKVSSSISVPSSLIYTVTSFSSLISSYLLARDFNKISRRHINISKVQLAYGIFVIYKLKAY